MIRGNVESLWKFGCRWTPETIRQELLDRGQIMEEESLRVDYSDGDWYVTSHRYLYEVEET